MHYPRLIILLTTLFVGVWNVAANAQSLQATLSHYSTDQGLCSNTISHLVQDDYGYIWISTWNGLSRFDGYHFYNYTTGPRSLIDNLHNRIKDITVDSEQNVWMRMYDNRVFVLKRSVDRIINPFDGITGNEEFRTNSPVMVTSAGDVLVNIEGIGLYKMRVKRENISTQLISTAGFEISSMAEGYQNDIWLGTDKGVHRIDYSNLTVERKGHFQDERVTRLFSNGYNLYVGTQSGKILSFSYGQDPMVIRAGGSPITGLFVDSHSFTWFSDREEGVSCIRPDVAGEKRYRQRVIMPDNDGSGAEFNEAYGYVWMRMNHGGFGYYDRETDEVAYFHNDPSNTWNLSNTINAVLELDEGVVWESTARRGLDKLEIMKHTIDRIQLDPNQGASPTNEVRAILYDNRKQNLIIGNKQGSLFLFGSDGRSREFSKNASGAPLGRIYGVSQDASGNLWVSCKGDGLYQFKENGEKYDIVNYRHNKNNEWSLNDDRCYQAVEDHDGNMWVATFGGGVNLMTYNKLGQRIFMHCNNVMKKYPYNSFRKVRTVAIDNEGNCWAGTTDGILVMSYKNHKLSIQQLKPSKRDPEKGLMSNDIVCLACDRQGDMWVGTSGGGLSHTIGKDLDGNWIFENFGAKDGLPSEEIRSIAFDDRGCVWFSTDHILCSYDTSKRIFSTFSTLDGVGETQCSENATVCLPNGNILFGTVDGYYLVDRSKLVAASGNMLKLRITDFWVDDRLQSPRLSGLYDYYVPDSREVRIPRHGASFSFRFAALNYQLQHRVHYQYMMEGHDREWRNADRSRMANYNSMPTGTYRFIVKAFLLEAPDKYDLKQIEVIVPPYFLLSSNAIWLYMLLAIALGIWLLFARQNHLYQKEKIRIAREGPRRRQQSLQKIDADFLIFLDDYLHLHYSDPMLSVDEMVAASALTNDKFARVLYQSTGRTPKEYIVDYRVKRAIEKLENTDDTIAEIAYSCGFIDAAAFNRQFQAKTGMLPSRYRDMSKN